VRVDLCVLLGRFQQIHSFLFVKSAHHFEKKLTQFRLDVDSFIMCSLFGFKLNRIYHSCSSALITTRLAISNLINIISNFDPKIEKAEFTSVNVSKFMKLQTHCKGLNPGHGTSGPQAGVLTAMAPHLALRIRSCGSSTKQDCYHRIKVTIN
jgi:hypothetical protein